MLVAVVQLAVAGGAIVRSELALRTGEAFRFRIQPVDPVDAFRGRYVAIRFAIDRAPVADDLELRTKKRVFAPIEIDADGFAILGQADVDPPADGPYLRLRAGGIYPDEEGNRFVWVSMPFRSLLHGRGPRPEGRTGRVGRTSRPARGLCQRSGS